MTEMTDKVFRVLICCLFSSTVAVVPCFIASPCVSLIIAIVGMVTVGSGSDEHAIGYTLLISY